MGEKGDLMQCKGEKWERINLQKILKDCKFKEYQEGEEGSVYESKMETGGQIRVIPVKSSLAQFLFVFSGS